MQQRLAELEPLAEQANESVAAAEAAQANELAASVGPVVKLYKTKKEVFDMRSADREARLQRIARNLPDNNTRLRKAYLAKVREHLDLIEQEKEELNEIKDREREIRRDRFPALQQARNRQSEIAEERQYLMKLGEQLSANNRELKLQGDVCVGFGPSSHKTEVLADVNLSVEKNEFIAIIGFSGSGKSTLMSLLAGLHTPDQGQVRLHGDTMTKPGPDRGIVFQNYSLLPWLSVYGNIALAVKQVFPGMTRGERKEYVQHYIDLVSLTASEWKKPHELSGGMRQRLSLARTLSMKPDVLLLDEPLSALDALTRAVLQDEIVRIWEEDRRTVVMVTNDVDEAVLMADRIVPLTPGPKATLARDFRVTLERPRDRATLNFNPEFKKLRNDVTRYMLDINAEAKELRVSQTVELPDIQPVRFSA